MAVILVLRGGGVIYVTCKISLKSLFLDGFRRSLDQFGSKLDKESICDPKSGYGLEGKSTVKIRGSGWLRGLIGS